MRRARLTAHSERSMAAATFVGVASIILYLISAYTYVTVFVTPSVPWVTPVAGIIGIFLLAKNFSQIRTGHIWSMLLFVFVAFLSMVFAPEPISMLEERAKSLMLLTYSISMAYGAYLELIQWRRGTAARVFLVASVLILVGCFLEIYTPLKDISDSFRQFAFLERRVYVADVRDIRLFGVVRPKLFTSEPSHVAKFFLLSITIWLILEKSRSRFLVFFVLLSAGMMLIGCGSGMENLSH